MDTEAQSAIARLNGLLDDLDSMYENSVGSLETRLSKAKSALEKVRGRRGGQPLTSANAVADADSGTAESAGDAERAALAEKVAQYEQRIAEMESELAAAAAKDERIAQLEHLEDTVREKEETIAELNATVEELRARDAQQDKADEKLLQYEQQVDALKTTIQEKSAQIDSLEKHAEELEARATQQEEQGQTGAAQLADLTKTVDELRAKLEAKAADVQSAQERVKSLEQELQQRDATIAALEEKTRERDEEIASVKQQLDKAIADSGAEQLKQEVDEKSKRIEDLEASVRTKEEERAKLELEVKMLLGEIEGLRYQTNDLEMLQDKVKKLEKDLKEERAAIVKMKAQQTGAPRAGQKAAKQEAPQRNETSSPTKRVRAAAGGGKGRRGTRKQMGEILVEAGVLTQEQLEEVIAFQATDPKRKLGSVVVERGYATEEVIAAALAAQMHVRFIENLEDELQPGVIKLVPNHLINNHRCVPLALDAGELLVAMANPLDLIGIENIELATNMRVDVAAATPSEIDKIIAKYFNRTKARE